jgi:hypothetical protein
MADLSFVEGDPLTDIRAAAAVRRVMIGGALHTVDDLMKPFTAPAAANTPALVRAATRPQHKHDPRYWWHEPERARNYCCT